MFNGIVENLSILSYLKYILLFNSFVSFIVLKVDYLNYLYVNLGFSFILQGICLTLDYKYHNFLEFNLSYETIKLCNIFFKLLNTEKSIMLFDNINGYFSYGHINTYFFLKDKYFFINDFLKICFFCNFFLRKFILYKYSIFINGINLTINKIEFLDKNIYFCVNLIDFTIYCTSINLIKIFDFVNVEFDFTIFFILNFFYLN